MLCLFSFPITQLLVQFVQNASIPLVQGLEDSESKHCCLPLLAPAESSLCTPLELTGEHMLTSVVLSTIGQSSDIRATSFITTSNRFGFFFHCLVILLPEPYLVMETGIYSRKAGQA